MRGLWGDDATYGETAPIKGDGPLTPLSAVRIKAAAVIARAVDPYVLSQYEFYV